VLHCESIAQRSRLHDWEIRPHRHESFLQLLLLRGGTGEARLDGVAVPIATPCVIVVPPGRPHGFRFSRDVDGIVLTVVAVRLRALVGGTPALWACFDAPRLQRLDAGSQAIATLLQAIADEFAADRPWREGRSALAVAHDRLQLEAERDLVYSGLDVKAIADTLGVSDAAYFSRFFAKRTGLTPSAFRARAIARLAGDAG
jgi:hypothetical protein